MPRFLTLRPAVTKFPAEEIQAANGTLRKQDLDYGSKSQITSLQCHDS
jgi:hypothetical protein